MADPAVEEKMRELRATVDSVHRIFQEKDIRFGKMKDEERQKLREAQELWDKQKKAEESALEQKVTMADPAVKKKKWYQQWRHTVAQNLEQVSRWGAETIFLVGIKGTQTNYCTMMEWPAFFGRPPDRYEVRTHPGRLGGSRGRSVQIDSTGGIHMDPVDSYVSTPVLSTEVASP
eukprot:SAG22_NODE_2396_length_2619_cov_1.800794_3_plen_175_part_00